MLSQYLIVLECINGSCCPQGGGPSRKSSFFSFRPTTSTAKISLFYFVPTQRTISTSRKHLSLLIEQRLALNLTKVNMMKALFNRCSHSGPAQCIQLFHTDDIIQQFSFIAKKYCYLTIVMNNEHKSVSMRVRTIFCCLVFLGHSSRLGVFPVDHLRKVSGPESFSTPTPPRYSFITPTAVFHEWQNKKPMIYLLP